MDIQPFEIHIDPSQVDDLQRRLQATRWPATLDRESWSDGASLAFVERLLHHWLTRFDWRAQERRLNTLPHFTAKIDGLSIHFVHQRGTGPDPLPLILTHGWPGSFIEMERIIPLLTDPAAHGGDPADAFDVVVPSLPGYGFSEAPREAGLNTHGIAGLWLQLMRALGYSRFGAQGGDIGAGVSTWLAQRFPENIVGIHLNYIPGSYRPPRGESSPPVTPQEQAYLDTVAAWIDAEGAYAHLQGTKPQTLAYALSDSPVGLAAWMGEKIHAWCDDRGDFERVIPLDTVLTDVCLYWFSGNVTSAFRLYKENRARPIQLQPGERITPPLGVAVFPRELPMPPRSWVERGYNVIRWTDMPRGGHFAAMEQPELLAAELREFFRPLRGSIG